VIIVKLLRAAWQKLLRRGTALPPRRVRELSSGLKAGKTALFSFTAAMEE